MLVDVEGAAFFSVDTFPLRNVAVAADIAFYECMVGKQQIGLDFPSEEGHVYAKVMRLEGRPHLSSLRGGFGDGVRRVVLPDRSVLVVADGEFKESLLGKNVSTS